VQEGNEGQVLHSRLFRKLAIPPENIPALHKIHHEVAERRLQ